jgi:hypothetical protein
MAENASDGGYRLRAHAVLGSTARELGEVVTARQHLERAVSFHDPERHIKLVNAMGADPGIISLMYLSTVLIELGYPDQGFAAAQRAFALGKVQPQSLSMAWGLTAMWRAQFARGAIPESMQVGVFLFPPSLQWVPWPPLAGALRVATFAGTMGSYDCYPTPFLPPRVSLPWWQVLLAEGLFASLGTTSFPWELVPFGSPR